MRRAWVFWTPRGPECCGVVVYAETRGQARSEGGAEMSMDFGETLDCRVLRAPNADHLAESRKQPDGLLMRELGFQDWSEEYR